MKSLFTLFLCSLLWAGVLSVHADTGSAETGNVTVDTRDTQPRVTVGPTAAKATGKKLVLKSQKAKKVKGVVAVANRGSLPDVLLVRGAKGNAFFKVTYTRGGNITAQVTTGKYRTTSLSNGGKIPITVTIAPNKKKLTKVSGKKGKKVKTLQAKSLSLSIQATSTATKSAKHKATIQAKTIKAKL